MRIPRNLMKKMLLAIAAVTLLFACASRTSRESVAVQSSTLTLLPPNLANHPGLLCLTDMPNVAANVTGPDPNGWVQTLRPRADAVLGGSGNGSDIVAATDLEFQITASEPAWQKSIYGARAQVCAELGVQNACNLERVCWWADGHWSIEQRSQPNSQFAPQCAPDAGGAPDTVQASGLLTGLTSGHTYRILAQASPDGGGHLALGFFLDGARILTRTLALAVATQGFSGFSVEQLTARVRIQGEATSAGVFSGWASASAVASEGAAEPEGALACGAYPSTQPPVDGLSVSLISSCPPIARIVWNAPAGTNPSRFVVYRDGYVRGLTIQTAGNLFFSDDAHELFPNTTYQYEVGSVDDSGALSMLQSVEVQTPAPCSWQATGSAMHAAALLMRFDDAPGTPFTRDEAQSWLFGGPGTTSVAEFLRRASLGRVNLTGDTFEWINLGFTIQPTCAFRLTNANIDPAGDPDGQLRALGLGYGCSLYAPNLQQIAQTQLAGQGVNLASYDAVFIFVHGDGAAGDNTYLFSASHGPIDIADVAHEIGHNFGLDHSGNWACPQSLVGPSLADMLAGGCFPARYGPFDPMGVSAQQFDTASLYRIGWLTPDQMLVAESGGTYALRKWDPTSGVTRHLRIPLEQNAFYYVEYRTEDGANAFLDCETFDCMPKVTGGLVPGKTGGVYVWLWKDSNSNVTGEDTSSLYITHLGAGETFTDPYRGVSVEAIALNGDTAQVQVRMCGDRQQNGTETDVDCGGGACGPCAGGQRCAVGADCVSTLCQGGLCVAPSCQDGIANNGETGIDCGGPCAPCTCHDGVRDASETDVDCGGPCAPCALKKRCTANADCVSQVCAFGRCSNFCTDGVKDAFETDVDCGGPCAPCADGGACAVPADCASGACLGNVCAAASCTDGVVNGGESDTDCGGATACPRCALAQACRLASDCSGGACVEGRCALACALPALCQTASPYNQCVDWSEVYDPTQASAYTTVPGQCIDWSQLGAKPCNPAHGGSDCPSDTSFPIDRRLGRSMPMCIEATPNGYALGTSGGSSGLGYCALYGTYSDPTGQFSCTPNPCGPGGHCNYMTIGAASLVECYAPR
jgi:hypothetical protein